MNNQSIYETLCIAPQTRKSLLKNSYNKGTTELNKLNRRLESMLHSYEIGCGLLNGLHRGEIIFFPMTKSYFIFVVKDIDKVKYFYTTKIKDKAFGRMELLNCYKFINDNWKKVKNKVICRKNIISVY